MQCALIPGLHATKKVSTKNVSVSVCISVYKWSLWTFSVDIGCPNGLLRFHWEDPKYLDLPQDWDKKKPRKA